MPQAQTETPAYRHNWRPSADQSRRRVS